MGREGKGTNKQTNTKLLRVSAHWSGPVLSDVRVHQLTANPEPNVLPLGSWGGGSSIKNNVAKVTRPGRGDPDLGIKLFSYFLLQSSPTSLYEGGKDTLRVTKPNGKIFLSGSTQLGSWQGGSLVLCRMAKFCPSRGYFI